MKKHEITIVVPSLTPFEGVTVYKTFLESAIREHIYVQFVYLRNGFENTSQEKATIEKFDTHEVLYVTHDRLFHTAEENLYRVQDFIDLLKPRLFFIGNDDELDWDLFKAALDTYDQNQLDALGLQIMFKQFNEDNGYATLPLMAAINTEGPALDCVKRLMAGEVLDSATAYGAIQSVCGPVWWPTYIGSHIYSREVFSRILQYRFAEPICSHLFMQIEFFSRHQLRYGFFNQPVINRLGHEFMNQRKNTSPEGGVKNHRTVFGHTKIQNVVYLSGMTQLEEDTAFNLIATALGTAIRPAEGYGMVYGCCPVLIESISWSRDVIREGISGKSHYFPNDARSGSLQDLRYVYLFLNRLQRCIENYPAIYQPLTEDTRKGIMKAEALLKYYLNSFDAKIDLLQLAHHYLIEAQENIPINRLADMNRAAFDAYLEEKTAATFKEQYLPTMPLQKHA